MHMRRMMGALAGIALCLGCGAQPQREAKGENSSESACFLLLHDVYRIDSYTSTFRIARFDLSTGRRSSLMQLTYEEALWRYGTDLDCLADAYPKGRGLVVWRSGGLSMCLAYCRRVVDPDPEEFPRDYAYALIDLDQNTVIRWFESRDFGFVSRDDHLYVAELGTEVSAPSHRYDVVRYDLKTGERDTVCLDSMTPSYDARSDTLVVVRHSRGSKEGKRELVRLTLDGEELEAISSLPSYSNPMWAGPIEGKWGYFAYSMPKGMRIPGTSLWEAVNLDDGGVVPDSSPLPAILVMRGIEVPEGEYGRG